MSCGKSLGASMRVCDLRSGHEGKCSDALRPNEWAYCSFCRSSLCSHTANEIRRLRARVEELELESGIANDRLTQLLNLSKAEMSLRKSAEEIDAMLAELGLKP